MMNRLNENLPCSFFLLVIRTIGLRLSKAAGHMIDHEVLVLLLGRYLYS